jgi:hypothetical protein
MHHDAALLAIRRISFLKLIFTAKLRLDTFLWFPCSFSLVSWAFQDLKIEISSRLLLSLGDVGATWRTRNPSTQKGQIEDRIDPVQWSFKGY